MFRKFAPWVAVAALAIGGIAVAQETARDGRAPDLADGERTVSMRTGGSGKATTDPQTPKIAGELTAEQMDEIEDRLEKEREKAEEAKEDARKKREEERDSSPQAPVAPAPVEPVPQPQYWDDQDWDDDDWDDDWDDDDEWDD